MERVTGIEPALEAWKASVLPLNHTRIWSGRQDSNLRHPAPKAGALPNCATSRRCTAASIIAEESKSAGKTLQAISPCPSPLHPPYEHRPLTKFARPLPLSTRFTKVITTIRIYAPHFFTSNITWRVILSTLFIIALSNSIGMRMRTLFKNLILAGEREADTMRYPRKLLEGLRRTVAVCAVAALTFGVSVITPPPGHC